MAVTDSARTVNMLGALAVALHGRIHRAMAGSGIESPSDHAALSLVFHRPGMTVGELAAILELSPSSTVRLVDRLQAKGLLVRRALGSDARHTGLEVAASGRRRVQKMMQSRLDALARSVAGLGAEDVEPLDRLLETLLAGLTETSLGADRICRLCDEQACRLDTCPVECKARTLV